MAGVAVRRISAPVRSPLSRPGRRLVAGVAVLLVAVGVAVAVADPFTGGSPAANGSADNAAATSLTTVKREDLSQQTQVSATLGYADASTIAVSAGTAPSNVQQAQQMASAGRSALDSARAGLATDRRAFDQARAMLAADRLKLAIDCSGENAAGSATTPTGGSGGSATSTPCATDTQTTAADAQSVAADSAKVQADGNAVATATTSLAAANQSLAAAQSSAAVYGQTSVYTMLPKAGQIVRRGQALYGIGGAPVVLFYGGTTVWRVFRIGMSPGRDVAELNRNLRALGYGAPSGSAFTSGTEAAIRNFQSAHGIAGAGVLLIGSVVFEPGAVRVTSVTPTMGAPVQAGPVLAVTATRRVVTISLDASQQSSIKVGDAVTITLPDNSTTPGHVSFVGTVATIPSTSDQGGGGGSTTPTIEVDVKPDHAAATGRLDQAPVDVSITTATVRNVLTVPVNALLALAGGGYAVEVESRGVRRLVGVSVGLFDDGAGMVAVSGPGLSPGQRVVVPIQ
jgi:peptidoglycan hydrolase-like protein with peptidoglycan-binding domain